MAGQIDYFEIGTPDPDAARAFYGGLFGWAFDSPSPEGYWMVDEARGGLWDTSAMGGGSWAIFYVRVDDVADAVNRATALGATIAVPLVDNGSIEFAHLTDPAGSRFAVWRPKSTT